MRRSSAGVLALLAALGSAARSLAAEELPSGLLETKTASQGREDVATSGFESAPDDDASDDATELKLSGGGLLTGGNAEALAVTSSARFRLRRAANQLSAAAAANYGQAASEGEEERRTNVENLQGKLRYDRFLSERIAAFVAQSALRDRFQGLALRLNLDPGVSYYLLEAPKHRLWGELGYDLQYDFRTDAAVLDALRDGTALERTKVQHSGRLFAGYENNQSEALAFDFGLELLQSVTEKRHFRLALSAGLSSRIAGNFSVATTFNLRYDHAPLPDVERTDYASAVSLVYQLF